MAKVHKIAKSSELLWALGIIFIAFGAAICNKANLGVSMIVAPTFAIYEAVAPFWSGFSVGMIEYLVQGALLIILCITVRRFKPQYLFAFVVAIIYGYTLNFFIWILGSETFDSVILRYVMTVVGCACTSLGVACCFRTYMPLQVYELFVTVFSRRYKVPMKNVKWGFDITLLLISIVLAFTLFGDAGTFDWSTIFSQSFHSIGMGTLIATIINAPLISLSGRFVDWLFLPTAKYEKLKKKVNVID